MKRESQHPSNGKLRGLFCVGLASVLAAGLVLNSAAANTTPIQYDVAVTSSSTHTAVLSGGELWFWGTNDQGQFPDSDLVYTAEPVKLLDGVTDAAVEDNRTLVVSENHRLRAYGIEPATGGDYPSDGALLARDAAQVEAGGSFAAYVNTSGSLYTWGKNGSGQLGNGNTDDTRTPVKILDGVKKVSLGNIFGLALTEDGTVYGWGDNSYCQLGYETPEDESTTVTTPVKVAEGVQDISAGYNHACLLKKDGTLWTCGDNTYSQTGVGNSVPYNALAKVLSGVRSISAGDQHNFAVTKDGAVYVWGYGVSGQLGNGSTSRIATPTESKFDYVQVFACDDNTFGISPEGYLFSFGSNNNYRLGKSDGSDSILPMHILDKDMNWVYPEFEEEDLHQAEEKDPASSAPSDDTSDTSSTVSGGTVTPDTSSGGSDVSSTPVEEKPEIVSDPFISGYPDGTFHPRQEINRAEFLTMLIGALRDDYVENANGSSSFSDVPVNAWYGDVVAYAQKNEIVFGRPDGTFGPTEPITRSEASIMTARALGLSTDNVPDAGYTDLVEGSDANKYINALSAEDILSGDGNGLFRPGDKIKRSEAVTVVARACGFRPTDEQKAAFLEAFPESPFEDVPAGDWYYANLLRGVGYVDMPVEEPDTSSAPTE